MGNLLDLFHPTAVLFLMPTTITLNRVYLLHLAEVLVLASLAHIISQQQL